MTLAIGVAVFTTLVPALTQTSSRSFGRMVAGLSAPEREAIRRAQREVLEKAQPGALSVWTDEKTGHSGEARIRRTYQQNGMPCAEVEHVLKVRDVSQFTLPFCRTSDGMWRLAY